MSGIADDSAASSAAAASPRLHLTPTFLLRCYRNIYLSGALRQYDICTNSPHFPFSPFTSKFRGKIGNAILAFLSVLLGGFDWKPRPKTKAFVSSHDRFTRLN